SKNGSRRCGFSSRQPEAGGVVHGVSPPGHGPSRAAGRFRFAPPAASPRAEATLSRKPRTPPLPATHVAVGSPWLDRGPCPSIGRPAVTPVASCRTVDWFGGRALPELPPGEFLRRG